MPRYAVLDDDQFVEFKELTEAPVLEGKPYRRFLPVVDEYGEPFEGEENGNWVIRVEQEGPVVPLRVTARQARLALLNAGHLAAVQAFVDAGEESLKIAWEYSTEIGRADPLVLALAPALGLSDSDLDALFIAGAAL